jgi:hypothetical protein
MDCPNRNDLAQGPWYGARRSPVGPAEGLRRDPPRSAVIKEAEKQNLGVNLTSGEKLHQTVSELVNTPATVVNIAKTASGDDGNSKKKGKKKKE